MAGVADEVPPNSVVVEGAATVGAAAAPAALVPVAAVLAPNVNDAGVVPDDFAAEEAAGAGAGAVAPKVKLAVGPAAAVGAALGAGVAMVAAAAVVAAPPNVKLGVPEIVAAGAGAEVDTSVEGVADGAGAEATAPKVIAGVPDAPEADDDDAAPAPGATDSAEGAVLAAATGLAPKVNAGVAGAADAAPGAVDVGAVIADDEFAASPAAGAEAAGAFDLAAPAPNENLGPGPVGAAAAGVVDEPPPAVKLNAGEAFGATTGDAPGAGAAGAGAAFPAPVADPEKLKVTDGLLGGLMDMQWATECGAGERQLVTRQSTNGFRRDERELMQMTRDCSRGSPRCRYERPAYPLIILAAILYAGRHP